MKKTVMRYEQFIREKYAVVLLKDLITPTEHHYQQVQPKGERRSDAPEMMLRTPLLQNWYASSDLLAEETLYDNEACADVSAQNSGMTASRTKRLCSSAAICSTETA